jgi:uncharacterized protein YukE
MQIPGNVGGMQQLAGSLGDTPKALTDTAEFLSKRVDDLVHDAGWNGGAAEAFKGAWERDSAALVQLGQCSRIVSDALSTLATKLADAQRRLDNAVADAQHQGVSFTTNGPIAGPYTTPQAAQAATDFGGIAKQIYQDAQTARDDALKEIYTVLAAIDPTVQADTSLLSAADVGAIAPVLKGYYTSPKGVAEDFEGKLKKVGQEYADKQFARQQEPKGSDARKLLNQEIHALRDESKGLTTSLASAERFADHFKGGKLLSTSLGDIAKAYGLVGDEAKLARLLDGLPGIDVAGATLATAGQMKEDEEKGWSTTHALLADGGANLAGLVGGVGADFIPFVGPFVSPVIGYGVGALVYEGTHEGHWTEHIHDDGVVQGTLEGIGDTANAFYEKDVKDMGSKVVNAVEHPVDTAKKVWQALGDLI